jgi:hypothetical protein
MATAEKVPMLAEGHRKLTEQVKHLKTVERPRMRARTATSPKTPNIMRQRSGKARSRR